MTSALPLGSRSLTATYRGDAHFLGRISPSVIHRVGATFAPAISRLRDVGGDQGRQLRVFVSPSLDDYAGASYPIVRYSVFRRIDPGSSPARLERSATGDRSDAGETAAGGPAAIELAGWDAVGSMDASADTIYSIVVPTLSDSNGTGIHRATFFVRAVTATPSVFYDSAPDSAYTLDNLAPAPPAPFTGNYASGATHLHWGPNGEPDLWYYRLYRGSSAGFVPGPGNLIATPSDTGYADPGPAGNFYKISAVDVNGNEGGFALLTPEGTTDVAGAATFALALESVRPNPSRGDRLSISFSLSGSAPARVQMLDVTGRSVMDREVGAFGAGPHTIELAPDRALPPGLYLVRLVQAGQVRVTRFAVLK
jgi:hypothetical protein